MKILQKITLTAEVAGEIDVFFKEEEEEKEAEVQPPKKKSKKDEANRDGKSFYQSEIMKTLGLMKKILFTFLIDFMKSFLKFKIGQNGVFFN